MAAGGVDDDGSGGEGDDVNRGNPEENDASQMNPIKKQWLSLSPDNRDDIKTTSASFVFALLLRLFIIEPRFIPSLSMFPTFEVGDQLLVEKVSKVNRHYQRRDVVVFNPPEAYVELTGNTEALIKRVVGVAGDSIEVKGKHLFVNGVEQEEPFTNELPDYTLKKLMVPEGMVLVLGDNRNYSFDSHIWGFLPERNVIGRAVLKYWPPWRLGTVEGGL
jgi:signal peptidase I